MANSTSESLTSYVDYLFDSLVKSRFIEMFGSVKLNDKGLEKATLKAVCTQIVDGSHNPSKGGEPSDYLMLSSKNILDGAITYDDPRFLSREDFDLENKRTQVKTGDILMTIVGTIGRTAIVPEDAGNLTFQRSVAVLHLNDKLVDPVFLKCCLDSIQSDIDSEAHGSSQKGIYLNQVEKIPVLVPEMNLQKKFALFVHQVDKSKFVFKQLVSKFDQLVKSRFIEMFDNNPDYQRWPIQSMDKVCEVVTDGSHFSPEDVGEGYPMLSVKDMGESDFDYSDCKHVSQKDYDYLVKNGCKPLAGDVLIAKDGSFFKKGFVVKEEKEQAILSSIAIMRPKKSLMNSDYLVKFLLSDKVLSTVSSMTSGTALKRVILKKFKSMKVTVPPINLQNEFVDFVHQVDKSKFEIKKRVDKLNQMS